MAAEAVCEEETFNLAEVIEQQDEQEALEEDARAVLGRFDDSSCTYEMVYIKKLIFLRQAA